MSTAFEHENYVHDENLLRLRHKCRLRLLEDYDMFNINGKMVYNFCNALQNNNHLIVFSKIDI